MEEQVGRVVGNVLAAGGEIFLPEVGSLCVERRRAQRLSRRSVRPPYRAVTFTPQRRGVSLVEEIARVLTASGMSEAEAPAGRTGGVRPLAGTRPGGGDPDRMRRRRAETGPFHPGRGFRPAAQSAGTCAREGAFRRPARLGDLDRSGGCRGRGRNRRILLSDDPSGAFRRSLRGPKPVGGRCRGCGRRSGNRCGGNGRKRCRCGGCRRRTGCG